MFSGCFTHIVDEKNRISIPAKFRDELGEEFVLTKGPDGCLWGLPKYQWEIIKQRASQSVTIQRFFLASAVQCSPGAKGRILLPDNLRKHADIKAGDEVVVIGVINRFEIWNARRWDAVDSQLTSERLQKELPDFFTS